MLYIHPFSRLSSAILIVLAIFLAKSLAALISVYACVVMLVFLSRIGRSHFRFVAVVSLPLLFSLLFVWGWVIDPHKMPISQQAGSGINYALFLWLRIVAWSGVLQFLFVPLVEKPSHLKGFLDCTGLGGLLGTLIIASIIFLPEMHRRVGQIIDARKAQGNPLCGLKGLRDIPTLLMPLLSSLLDSASKRAELWSHRGILVKGRGSSSVIAYSHPLSVFIFLFAFTSCLIAVMT